VSIFQTAKDSRQAQNHAQDISRLLTCVFTFSLLNA